MFVKLIEVKRVAGDNHGFLGANDKFTLGEIFLNPEQISHMKEDFQMERWLAEGLLPEGLNSAQKFTKVFINRSGRTAAVTVIGETPSVMEKIQTVSITHKQLLRG